MQALTAVAGDLPWAWHSGYVFGTVAPRSLCSTWLNAVGRDRPGRQDAFADRVPDRNQRRVLPERPGPDEDPVVLPGGVDGRVVTGQRQRLADGHHLGIRAAQYLDAVAGRGVGHRLTDRAARARRRAAGRGIAAVAGDEQVPAGG